MKIDLRQGLAQDHPAAVSGSVEIQMPEYQSQAPATFEGCCLCTGEGAYTVTGTLRFNNNRGVCQMHKARKRADHSSDRRTVCQRDFRFGKRRRFS